MSTRIKLLKPLEGDQRQASSPRHHAALSASAGTGKTHVLTARVLRLLLSGVDPASILCLTFTKAGAAEMAQRIHARLAYWVRMKDQDLRKELFALGEPTDPDTLGAARTLFARVLDAAGGGLRIQTIHAFAQSLLAAFPAEAGLTPGFRPVEGREEQLLARSTLAELVVEAEARGELGLIADLQRLSRRLGEGGAESFLIACARAVEALAALGQREAIEPRLRRAFGLPAGDIEEAIATECGDELFDVATLERIEAANRLWGSATGLACCEAIAGWRARDAVGRASSFGDIASLVLTRSGDPRKAAAGLLKADSDYAAHSEKLIECCRRLLAMRACAALVADLSAGLRAGQAYSNAYAAAKRSQGLVDFDDLISRAETLLLEPGMGDWVRYKLDQATDHILVDEAQDTNERQWNIVRALALEYFAGEGASGPRAHRTIFTVGDYKQAIFGFQGTDPRSFELARAWFSRAADDAGERFLDLSMDLSFRSPPPILELVDRVIADLGHERLGLPRPPNRHGSSQSERPGSVVLWQAMSEELADALDEEAGEEGWTSETLRRYAGRLARQVKAWIERPFYLESQGRGVRPEDILILVRRRSTLASLLVARLHAEGVPVAGVDRLLLSAPLAVQDLLAAARFAMQPLDDLNLASLLVSPLFGWSQEELFAAAFGRKGALWPHLRELCRDPPKAAPRCAATVEGLLSLLNMADFTTPYAFFETILSGPLQGRRRLFERLGAEARDPIDELLAAALRFESATGPSLQAFVDWFARGEVEIVRDPSAPLDAVRVMTVHGAKGLQSPIVILADACADPERARGAGRGAFASVALHQDLPPVPIFRPRKDELVEPLRSEVEARDRREREEHWRLLYVGLTRAEERLYVGGSLGPADRKGPAETSWYSVIERSLDGLGSGWQDDPIWGRVRRFGEEERRAARTLLPAAPRTPLAEPGWMRQPAPAEARPPRPLAPSAPADDDLPYPPPSPEMRSAAERGRLLHQLFERLPGVAPEERARLADAWLGASAGVENPEERQALIRDSCAIVSDPLFSDLFSPRALAEAPIAAVTADGFVVSGTVDRLLVTKEAITLVDFKTGRNVPATAEEAPASHLRQMAAYVAALEIIFPNRPISAGLLYTAAPVLHLLARPLLAPLMPGAAVAGEGAAS